jgi:DNA-binding response OmpR family regulator
MDTNQNPQSTAALVCVIDDDVRVRHAVCNILRDAGFSTVDAADGEIGMKLVEETRPSVVVTDIVMPNREGIETIQALKASFPTLPILAMSGSCAPAVNFLELARHLGADDCIAKPFKPSELLLKIRNLLVVQAH